jgi:hypothetical protein
MFAMQETGLKHLPLITSKHTHDELVNRQIDCMADDEEVGELRKRRLKGCQYAQFDSLTIH